MLNPQAIRTYDFGAPVESYTPRDAILYALGLGLGSNPLDLNELRFLDERKLSVLPTFGVTRCTPGMWIRDPALGVDFGKLVHSAQWAEFPAPMPAMATVRGEAEVVSLTDRGEGKGAMLVLERRIIDAASGQLYCRLHQTLLLRGDGGFGGPPAQRDLSALPAGEPDAIIHFGTSSRAALIYRLSGDWNPLHLDPDIANKAGFSRPILQGLASYGIAGIAVSQAMHRDPATVSLLGCRFSGAVLPGDTLEFRVWNKDGSGAAFAAYVDGHKVLDAGEIAWRNA